MMRLQLTLIALMAAAVHGQQQQQTYSWQGREIPVEVVQGWAVAEGDILLGRIDETKPNGGARRDAAFGAKVWQGSRIPYVIDAGLRQQRDCLLEALEEWATRTSVKWIPRTDQSDYVVFRQSPVRGSFSFIGVQGGEQSVWLEEGACAEGLYAVITHEMGHVAGLFHEHQRPDRQRYIRVLPENTGRPTVFMDLLQLSGSPYGPYDYASIMHYGPLSGSPRGEPVLETIPKGIPTWLDQGRGPKLSAGDVDALARMYGATPDRTTISTNPPGLDLIIDGVRRTTPLTLNWEPGSSHSLEAVSPQSRPGARYEFARWNNDGRQSQTIVAGTLTHFAANFSSFVRVTGRANIAERGTVTVGPFGADRADDGLWRIGTPLVATATAAPGFYLARWSSGRGSRNPLPFPQFYPDPAVTEFVAEFEPNPLLTITSVPTGLQVRVDGQVYTTPAEFRWEPGSPHTVEWEREQLAGGSRYRLDPRRMLAIALAVKITGPPFDASLVGAYSVEHRIRATANPEAGGRVSVEPASPDGFYEASQRVRLVATPNPGYVFRRWRQEELGLDAAVDSTVAGPLDLVAEFEPEAKP